MDATNNAAADANIIAKPSNWNKLSDEQQVAIQQTNAERTRAAFPALVARGAVFVCSHSGGKDSDMLYRWMLANIPHGQMIVVHADLGDAEHTGTLDHARKLVTHHDVLVAKAITKDGASKWFLDMVMMRHDVLTARGDNDVSPWPKQGECQGTSDLKRGPIAKVIRQWVKDNNHSGLVVECLGRRADESERRAGSTVNCFKLDVRNSVAGREWYKVDPIADYTTAAVLDAIGDDLHVTYTKHGFERMSCCICVHGSDTDTATAAAVRPHLFAKYVAVERFTGKTMRMRSTTKAERQANAELAKSVRVTLEEYAAANANAELVAQYVAELAATGRIAQGEPVASTVAGRTSLNVLS